MAVEFTFDLPNQMILPQSPATKFTCQELINAIREKEADVEGIAYPQIAKAAGKEELSESVRVGITIQLLDLQQIEWYPGNYTAEIGGGNLVAECGDAVAYVEGGPQVEIMLSAGSTFVTPIPTAEEAASAVMASVVESGYTLEDLLKLFSSILMGKTIIDPGPPVTVYFRDLADTTDRVIAEMDGSERVDVELDPA